MPSVAARLIQPTTIWARLWCAAGDEQPRQPRCGVLFVSGHAVPQPCRLECFRDRDLGLGGRVVEPERRLVQSRARLSGGSVRAVVDPVWRPVVRMVRHLAHRHCLPARRRRKRSRRRRPHRPARRLVPVPGKQANPPTAQPLASPTGRTAARPGLGFKQSRRKRHDLEKTAPTFR